MEHLVVQQIVLVRILKIYRTVKWAILTDYIVYNTFIGQSFAPKEHEFFLVEETDAACGEKIRFQNWI